MCVGISMNIDFILLQTILSQYFTNKSVLISENLPNNDWPEILCTVSSNESEFPILLSFWTIEDSEAYEQCMRIACFLSKKLNCRTICDGTKHGDDNSPYWSIIWDNGISYLANDSNSKLFDGEGGKVNILREISIYIDQPNNCI